LLEGQTVVLSRPAVAAASAEPDDRTVVIKRLTALKGVGEKTAQAAVAAFGPGVLDVVRNDPTRVLNELGTRRAQPLIDAVADAKQKAAAPRKRAAKKATTKRAPRKRTRS
jgi:hypothetical protein